VSPPGKVIHFLRTFPIWKASKKVYHLRLGVSLGIIALLGLHFRKTKTILEYRTVVTIRSPIVCFAIASFCTPAAHLAEVPLRESSVYHAFPTNQGKHPMAIDEVESLPNQLEVSKTFSHVFLCVSNVLGTSVFVRGPTVIRNFLMC